MANKSPAYPMYAADFDTDTASWTNEEVGAYQRLLNYGWINKGIPNDTWRLAQIVRVSADYFDSKLWPIISKKFIPDRENTTLINPRQEIERQKQQEYRRLQSEAGKRGVEAKKQKGSFPFNQATPEKENKQPLNENSSNPASQKQALHLQSSSSFSNSFSFKEPTKEEISEASIPKIREFIKQASTALYEEKIFLKAPAFINKMRKRKKNLRSILHVLCRCYIVRPKDPWAYCEKIIQQEDGNYNAREYEKTHSKES